MPIIRKQPLPIYIKQLDLRDIKPRERNAGHLWCDKQVLRMLKQLFNKKDYKNLRNIYLTLCQIDSDFCEAREEFLAGNYLEEERELHNVTKTCATYAGMDRKTVINYMQILKELYLIKYGRKQDESGKIVGSYLILFEYIPFTDFYQTKIDHSTKIGTKANHSTKKPTKVKRDHIKNNTLVLTSSKKKILSESIGQSKNFALSKRLHFVFKDNGQPFAIDKWLSYPLKNIADRPILDIVTRLIRQKAKPNKKAIKAVVNYWNSFANRGKHNGLQIVNHRFSGSKTFYKIQILVTGLISSGTTIEGIERAIDGFEDLLNRSPHYGNNRNFDLIKFFTMPQTDPGRLFDDCLTGEYATSQKYFPNELRLNLRHFVNKCIKEQNEAYYGAIPDGVMESIMDKDAPDRYFAYLKRKGGDEEKSRVIVKREYTKMKRFLEKED